LNTWVIRWGIDCILCVLRF